MRTTLPLREIYAAQKTLRPVLAPTPMIHSPAISHLLGAEVWLKLECRQPTGSFKVRGALNKIHKLSTRSTLKGLVTGSAGNHGLGVAFAAQALDISPVTIVVPENAPDSKKMKLQQFPIELIEKGKTYEEAHQAALGLAQEHGWSYVPAYDDVDVIAGQGTIGLEIMEFLPEADIVVVPVGGGGLIAGIANAVKQIHPLCEIIGIQAEASPAAKLSLEHGQPYDPYDHEATIADGLAGGFGKVPFYLARMLIDRIELASESDFKESVYTLLRYEQIHAEPSGAITIHPVTKGKRSWENLNVVCVISGGNLSTELLKEIITHQGGS